MKAIEAVELFAVLKDLKLSGVDSSDRLKVIRNLRALREVTDKYNADLDLAKERLKPDGFDNLIMKMLESNEVVAAGGSRTVSDLEIASFNKQNERFNRDLKAIQIGSYNKDEKCFEGGMNNEKIQETLGLHAGSYDAYFICDSGFCGHPPGDPDLKKCTDDQ